MHRGKSEHSETNLS